MLIALYFTYPRITATTRATTAATRYRLNWLDYVLAAALAFSFVVVGYYKITDVDPKRWIFMIMPCHVFTVIQLWVWFDNRAIARWVFALMLHLPMGQWMALIFPDKTGYAPGLETWCYSLQHWLLVLMPLYAIATRTALIQPYSLRDACTGFLLENLYHTTVLSFVSIWSGLNLNFMLNPPKIGIVRSWGAAYRPVVMAACFVIIAVSHPISRALAHFVKWTFVNPLRFIGVLPSVADGKEHAQVTIQNVSSKKNE